MCDVIQKAKYDYLSDNIMFNISESSVIKTVKDSATLMNVTETMEADNISGKTNIWKNFINYELK